jgi:hypothetical protein
MKYSKWKMSISVKYNDKKGNTQSIIIIWRPWWGTKIVDITMTSWRNFFKYQFISHGHDKMI